jgi:hypothetical protein
MSPFAHVKEKSATALPLRMALRKTPRGPSRQPHQRKALRLLKVNVKSMFGAGEAFSGSSMLGKPARTKNEAPIIFACAFWV